MTTLTLEEIRDKFWAMGEKNFPIKDILPTLDKMKASIETERIRLGSMISFINTSISTLYKIVSDIYDDTLSLERATLTCSDIEIRDFAKHIGNIIEICIHRE